MKKVTVILPDTLTAIGLQQLMAEAFGARVTLASTFEQLSQQLIDDSQLFVTDAHTFLNHLDFFLPNKDKILLASRQATDSQQVHNLNIAESKESITTQLTPYFSQATDNDTQAHLTQREMAVLKLIVEGCINKEIADRLNISINTVLTHRKNITAKLGIKSVSGLSVYALMNGIVAPKPM